MGQPLVSIVMPAYNAEKYIAASIDSVLQQTYDNWELIIVDDGSRDRTAQIAQRFSASEDRIKYIFQPNRKLASARNTGIRNSAAHLIAFLDSDDLWLSEKLKLQVEVSETTDADIIFSGGYIFSNHDQAPDRWFTTVSGRFSGAEIFPYLFKANIIPVASVLARRSALCRVGLFDEHPQYYAGCEDYDLWLRLAKVGAVFYGMKEKLISYRVHPAAMSRKEAEMFKITIRMLEKYQHDESLSADLVVRRFRSLYRRLISALMKENKVAEARQYLDELTRLDRFGARTLIQRVLIRAVPGKYNYIQSRWQRFSLQREDQGIVSLAHNSSATPKTQKLYGVNFSNLRRGEALEFIGNFVKENKKGFVVTPNADHVVRLRKDPDLKQAYENASLILADGMPLVFASRLAGTPIAQRLSGADIFIDLLKLADERGLSLFLLGPLQEARISGERILRREYPKLKIVGSYSPPLGFEDDELENDKIISMINDRSPDFLFIFLGMPKQEKWINRNICRLKTRMAFCLGAAFDFYSGHVRRAPLWMQKLGMEWLWRLFSNPRRFAKRYLVDDFFPFLAMTFAEAWRSRLSRKKA